jgi:aldose 1-epimerase
MRSSRNIERSHAARENRRGRPAPAEVHKANRATASRVGGEPVITLERPRSRKSQTPQFLSAQILPARGMNIFQIKAWLPGTGQINVLDSPSLRQASKALNCGPREISGSTSFTFGGAMLLPFANRIRGCPSADGKRILSEIAGKSVALPANWSGKELAAEKHAIHGLMLNSQFEEIEISENADESVATGTLEAGNFGGHWLSSTLATVKVILRNKSMELKLGAKNVGEKILPMGIGWHPYFAIPSRKRAQARLRIPARRRLTVNNYDDVFPDGEIVPVAGTPYDFAVSSAPLRDQFLDDSFTELQPERDGSIVCELLDPSVKYGLRLTVLTNNVHVIHVYAVPERSCVALEPQFNYPNPYGEEWGDLDTGMVSLAPGESVSYRVRLEIFQPIG